jgi:hypothetical protein
VGFIHNAIHPQVEADALGIRHINRDVYTELLGISHMDRDVYTKLLEISHIDWDVYTVLLGIVGMSSPASVVSTWGYTQCAEHTAFAPDQYEISYT